MRAIGIDFGAKRVGIAVCDSAGKVAVPYDVVQRSGDRARDHRRIAAIVTETESEIVIAGLPLSLDGSRGPAAKRILAELRHLERALSVPVETYDERLTTVTAERSLRELDMKAPARRKVVDKIAAAVILQGWLDQRAHREEPPA